MKSTVKIVLVSAVMTLLLMVSCTAKQLAKVDKAAQDANALAQAGKSLVESPVGAVIPLPVRGIIEIIAALLATGAMTWQQIRKSGILDKLGDLTTTSKAIVTAVDKLPDMTKAVVKAAVKTEMLDTATSNPDVTFDKLNAVVDELKAS